MHIVSLWTHHRFHQFLFLSPLSWIILLLVPCSWLYKSKFLIPVLWNHFQKVYEIFTYYIFLLYMTFIFIPLCLNYAAIPKVWLVTLTAVGQESGVLSSGLSRLYHIQFVIHCVNKKFLPLTSTIIPAAVPCSPSCAHWEYLLYSNLLIACTQTACGSRTKTWCKTCKSPRFLQTSPLQLQTYPTFLESNRHSSTTKRIVLYEDTSGKVNS